MAEVERAQRLKREQEAQIRQAAERRRQKEAHKREEELAKRRALEQEAANWDKAQQLRAYLAVLRGVLIAKHGEIQQGSQADQ